MKEFKNIKADSELFDEITHISRVLGKSKAQTLREIIKPLFEELEHENSAVLKVLKNPMRDMIIFEVVSRERYVRPLLKGEKA